MIKNHLWIPFTVFVLWENHKASLSLSVLTVKWILMVPTSQKGLSQRGKNNVHKVLSTACEK